MPGALMRPSVSLCFNKRGSKPHAHTPLAPKNVAQVVLSVASTEMSYRGALRCRKVIRACPRHPTCPDRKRFAGDASGAAIWAGHP